MRLKLTPELLLDNSYKYYRSALRNDLLVRMGNGSNQPFLGRMDEMKVAYLDFFHP